VSAPLDAEWVQPGWTSHLSIWDTAGSSGVSTRHGLPRPGMGVNRAADRHFGLRREPDGVTLWVVRGP